MPIINCKELRKMKDDEIESKLGDLKNDLSRLRNSLARGTLRKETGKIKLVKRNIARISTVITEKKEKINGRQNVV